MNRVWFHIVAFLFAALTSNGHRLFAQVGDTAHVHFFGGLESDQARKMIRTSDGGFLLMGTTASQPGASTNLYVVRLDAQLNCLWNTNVGSASVNRALDVIEDAQGDFWVTGFTANASYDAWLIHLTQDGVNLGEWFYGGSDWDFARTIALHPAGGVILGGSTYSQQPGEQFGWMFHVDESGSMMTQVFTTQDGDAEIMDMEWLSDTLVAVERTMQNDTPFTRLYILNQNLQALDTLQTTDSLSIGCVRVKDHVLYIAGYKWLNGKHSAYMQALHRNDFSSFYANYELQTDDSEWNDVLIDEHILLVGYTESYGLGLRDMYLQQQSIFGNFESALTFGGPLQDEAYAVVTDGAHLYFAGQRNVNGQNEAAVIDWNGMQIGLNYTFLEDAEGCFTIGMSEMIDSSDVFTWDMMTRQLRYTGSREWQSCVIFDTAGAAVFSSAGTRMQEVHVGQLASGIYVLHCLVDGHASTRRIFIP